MRNGLLLFIALLITVFAQAQNVGINNTNPGSGLDVKTSLGLAYNVQPGSYTVTATDYYVVLNGAIANSTFTLPAAVSGTGNFQGRLYVLKNASPSFILTIAANGSELIDGVASITILPGNTVELISTGAAPGAGTTWNIKAMNSAAGGTAITGSGTPNYVSKFSGTTGITNSNIYDNGTSVGIGNNAPNSVAILDLTNTANLGMLPPRLTTVQRNALTATLTSAQMQAIQGLTVYNTNTLCLEAFIGTSWQPIGCGCASAPAIPGSITGPSTVCQGYNAYLFTIAAIAGASSYNWTLPTGASIATGSNTTAITVNFASNAASGSQQISVAAGNSCGTSTTSNINFTVNQIPIVTSSPNNATICGIGAANSGNTSFSVTATGTAPTYQWQVNTGSGFANISNGSIYSNVTGATLNITGATPAYSGYQYKCVVSGTCTPSVISGVATLTVNPVPSVTNATTLAICSVTDPAIALTANTSSTFAWTLGTNTGSIQGSAAGSGSTISQVLTNPTNNTVGSIVYNVVPTGTTGSCVGSSTAITVSVNPLPVVATAATAVMCSDATSSIALTASVPSSYTWTLGTNTGGITVPAAGSGSTIAQTLNNPNNATAGSIVYIVVPTSTTGSCVGTTKNITLTVNPKPEVSTANTATICSGKPTAISLAASAASTFAWTLGTNTGAVTGATATSGSSITQTLTNPSNSTAGSIIYNVIATSTAGACAGPVWPITVTVNPLPAAPTPVAANPGGICAGSSSDLTATAANGSIQWYTVATAGSSVSTGASGATYTVSPTSTTTYYAEAIFNGCISTTRTSTAVLVTPIPAAPSSATASPTTVCGGSSNLTATSTGNNINWYTTATGGTAIGSSASGGAFSVTPTATTTYYAESQSTGYVFTNAGATLRTGPTQAQVNAAYAGTVLAGIVTVTSTGIQQWTVPTTGNYTITAKGASGGSTTYAGYGASVTGTVTLTAGTQLSILVGQMGSSNATGYSDGGGGGSFISSGGTLLLAAGGGGGGAQGANSGNTQNGSTTTTVASGSASQFGSSGAGYSTNGSNLTFTAYTTVAQSFTNGGTGQAGGQAGGWPGGTYGEGGFGGGGSACSCSTGGGGGGGGYVGGGGGPAASPYASGYGGSSYISSSATSTSSAVLSSFGNGSVSISLSTASGGCASTTRTPVTVTFITPATAPTSFTSNPTSVTLGASYTYTVTGATNVSSYVWTLPTGWTGSSSSNSITVTLPANNTSTNFTYGGNQTISVYGVATCGSNTSPISQAVVVHGTTAITATQTYTVPVGISSVTVDMAGAGGGIGYSGSAGGTAGLGGRIQATLSVTPSTAVYVGVGTAGGNAANSLSGGAAGSGGYLNDSKGGTGFGSALTDWSTSPGYGAGGGGGGASDIRVGGTALANRVLSAGGGGGSGSLSSGGVGGNGGQPATAGTGGYTQGNPGTSGAGGSATAAYNTGGCSNMTAGAAGTNATGGNGGLAAICNYYGGGGGGGGMGGGSGASGGGGGGGYSYTVGSGVSGVTTTTGYKSGNGYVNITW